MFTIFRNFVESHILNKHGTKPDFLIPGAPRSGTTSLVNVLAQHPAVYFPPIKEIQYFTSYYHQSTDWYINQFQSRLEESAIGEASTNYMVRDEAAERIYQFNPSFKLIFLLRNPIKRAYSHYKREVETRGVKKSFFECLSESNYYIYPGFYANHIKRFLTYFPHEQMKFVLFEDLIKNPNVILNDIFNFLNLDSTQTDFLELPKSNKSGIPYSLALQRTIFRCFGVKDGDNTINRYFKGGMRLFLTRINHLYEYEFSPLDPETYKWLERVYLDDIHSLCDLLGRDLFSVWNINMLREND